MASDQNVVDYAINHHLIGTEVRLRTIDGPESSVLIGFLHDERESLLAIVCGPNMGVLRQLHYSRIVELDPAWKKGKGGSTSEDPWEPLDKKKLVQALVDYDRCVTEAIDYLEDDFPQLERVLNDEIMDNLQLAKAALERTYPLTTEAVGDSATYAELVDRLTRLTDPSKG